MQVDYSVRGPLQSAVSECNKHFQPYCSEYSDEQHAS